MSSFLKRTATPGSIEFLLVCGVIWLALRWFWPDKVDVRRGWVFLIVSLYLVLGLPFVANRLADPLARVPSVEAASLRALETLVVFDGDNRRGRVGETNRAYALGHPGRVYVLGDDWLVDALIESGVPRDRIAQDRTTATTRDQIAWVGRRLARERSPTAIVASRLQMARIAALAKAAGLSVVLLPSPIDTEPPTEGVRLYVPTYIALRVSRDALYEHAALTYYAWRGWIGRP